MESLLAGFVFALLVAYSSANNDTDDVDEVDFLLGMNRGVIRLYNPGDGSAYDTQVFWLSTVDFMEVFYEAPLNLTGMEDVKMLKSIDRYVYHMRVMHPSLQRPPKTDPCVDKGCAHSCIASETTKTCECPPGQALNCDGVSCHDITNDKTHPHTTEYSTSTRDSVTTEFPNSAFTKGLTSSRPTEHSSTQIPTVLPNQESNSHLLYIGLCGFMIFVFVIPLLVYVWRRNAKKSQRPAIVYMRQTDQVDIT